MGISNCCLPRLTKDSYQVGYTEGQIYECPCCHTMFVFKNGQWNVLKLFEHQKVAIKQILFKGIIDV